MAFLPTSFLMMIGYKARNMQQMPSMIRSLKLLYKGCREAYMMQRMQNYLTI